MFNKHNGEKAPADFSEIEIQIKYVSVISLVNVPL